MWLEIIGGVVTAGAAFVVYEFWIAPFKEDLFDGIYRPLPVSQPGRTAVELAASGSREPVSQCGRPDCRPVDPTSRSAICPGGVSPHTNRIARFYRYDAMRLAASDLLFVAAMDRAECLDAELRDMRRHSEAVTRDEFFDECGTDEWL
jgi:hypothetical protein